jgi:hypothetical protein
LFRADAYRLQLLKSRNLSHVNDVSDFDLARADFKTGEVIDGELTERMGNRRTRHHKNDEYSEADHYDRSVAGAGRLQSVGHQNHL